MIIYLQKIIGSIVVKIITFLEKPFMTAVNLLMKILF